MKKLKDLKLGIALTRDQMKNTQGGSCNMGHRCGYYHDGNTTWGECDLWGYQGHYTCWCSATPFNAELSSHGGESACGTFHWGE